MNWNLFAMISRGFNSKSVCHIMRNSKCSRSAWHLRDEKYTGKFSHSQQPNNSTNKMTIRNVARPLIVYSLVQNLTGSKKLWLRYNIKRENWCLINAPWMFWNVVWKPNRRGRAQFVWEWFKLEKPSHWNVEAPFSFTRWIMRGMCGCISQGSNKFNTHIYTLNREEKNLQNCTV